MIYALLVYSRLKAMLGEVFLYYCIQITLHFSMPKFKIFIALLNFRIKKNNIFVQQVKITFDQKMLFYKYTRFFNSKRFNFLYVYPVVGYNTNPNKFGCNIYLRDRRIQILENNFNGVNN